MGKKLLRVFPSIKDIGLFKVFQEVNKTGKPKHFPLTRYEDKRITQWVENHIYKLPGGQIVAIYKDSSAEKLAQDELRESENSLKISGQKLKNLTNHINKLREKERKEISREIHDDIGQALTALKLDLSWISKKRKIKADDILVKIEEMKQNIDQTIKSIQKISLELRPGLLDDLGLVYAIKWQCKQFSSRSGIKSAVKISSEDLIVDETISVELFRILQEVLTNVSRHSNASKVKVTLQEKKNILELKIVDNGIGITEKKIDDANSLGLIGIHERVNSINGTILIKGKKNIGTEISVKVKLYRGE